MIERWIDWERRLEGARMTSVNIDGQRYQIFDEAVSDQENRSRVWQVKRMRASGTIYASNFFGHPMGVVAAPSWSQLVDHPAAYMKGTDLVTSVYNPDKLGSWFDEVRLNLGSARRRAASNLAPVRAPGGQILEARSSPLRVKVRKQRGQFDKLK